MIRIVVLSLVVALVSCGDVPLAEEEVARATLEVSVSPTATLTSAATESTYPAFGDQRASAAGRFTGTNALVVYIDTADAAPTLGAFRIDQNGERVGSAFTLASSVVVKRPALACRPDQCLVVFVQDAKVRGVRVDASGVVLDASPLELGASIETSSLAAYDDGSGITVAWSDHATAGDTTCVVRTRRVSAEGVVLGPSPTVLGSGAAGLVDVSVAKQSGVTVVAWDDVTATTIGRILAVRLDANGSALDLAPLTLLDAANVAERRPRLVARGAELLLVYLGQDFVYARTVTVGAPFVVGPATFLGNVESDTDDVAVSTDGTTTAVVTARVLQGSPVTYSVGVATIPSPLAQNNTTAWLDWLDGISTADVLPMSGGRVVVASVRRERPAGPFTNGFDVQTAQSSSVRRTVTLGAASAREPAATYTPLPGEFSVAYLEDAAFAGYGVRFARVSKTGALVDALPGVAVSGSSTTQWVTRFDSVRMTSIGAFHQMTWQKRSQDNFSALSSGVMEGATIDQGSPTSVGILREFSYVVPPYGTATGGDFATIFRMDYGTLRDRRITTTTDTYGSMALSEHTNVRAEGQRGIAWSTTGYAVLTPGVTTATKIPVTLLDDGGLSAANGTRSTLVVHRDAAGSTATKVIATLLNTSASTVTKAAFVIDSGSALVGPARVAFDGTRYNVFFIRGSTLSLVRISEDGALLDTAPSVIASDAYGPRAPAIATDRAGKLLVAYERFDASPGVRALRIATVVIDWNGAGGNANGTACTGAIQCASGSCVDGVCCSTSCGLGVNDCQACSVAAGGATDGVCGPVVTPARVCRASAGACDVAEVCDGVSMACPDDGRVAEGTLCGALGSTPCETDQRCDGSSVICPPKGVRGANTVCRASAGACDAVERCTGSSIVCPADGALLAGTECRASAGPCDRADVCDGVSKTCGADLRQQAGTTCRPQTGVCDAAELCDGTSVSCPTNLPAQLGVLCRPAMLVCDVPESCDGTSFVCPADAFKATSVVCRPAADICDVAESCPGTGPNCPAQDVFAPMGTVCRGATGPCDLVETCTGGSAACGADARRPRGTVCRPATGLCDIAESCTGGSIFCPDDRDRVDGSSCSNGLVCDGAEMCQAGECVTGEALVCEADAPCLESTGQCSVPTGSGCAVSHTRTSGAPWTMLPFAFIVSLIVRRRRFRRGLSVLFASSVLAGCLCGAGRVTCDDACVDVGYDERNCGGCGVTCGYGQCIEGECHALPASPTTCESDEQCRDGDVCNGVERCAGGRCRAGEPLACDDGLECTQDTCSSTLGSCLSTPTTATCGVNR